MSLFRVARPSLFAPRPNYLRTFLTTLPLRSSDVSAPQSPILARLQSDLKSAMRAKDTPRLNVLRSIMASISNASKTSAPVKTDASLYSLLQKQIKASNAAVEEFQKAKREDLVEKETKQLNVLNSYANGIPKVEPSEVDDVVAEVIQGLKEQEKRSGPALGKVMRALEGRVVDIEVVKAKISEALGEKK